LAIQKHPVTAEALAHFPALLGEHAAMLQRNLLYTAITRARRLVVSVGSRAALQTAVRRTDSRGHCTGLAERLKAGAAGRS